MKVLWGTKKREPNWREEILTEHEGQIPVATLWAKKNGYDRLRVADVDLNTPLDFKRTVN